MENIFKEIKDRFQRGGIVEKIIFINVGLFLLLRLFGVLLMLFGFSSNIAIAYVSLPANLMDLLYRPWSLFSYMFAHYEFWHIIFNMLWLYWFGHLFLHFFSSRNLGGLYIIGGLAGALFYLLSYNLFPYFENVSAMSTLIGASASVMAIVFAVSFYRQDYEINLLFIGRIKLIYLAIFTFLVDLLSITSSNAGGHIAHVGGALLGILFASQMKKGKDITRFVNRGIDKIVNTFKKKRTIKIVSKRSEADYDYNSRLYRNRQEIDKILEKLKKSGYNSLSSDEKKKLFDASKKY